MKNYTNKNFVSEYINSSRKKKFISKLDVNIIYEYENQYNVSNEQEFFFEYNSKFKSLLMNIDTNSEYSSDSEYEFMSTSSEDEDNFEYY